MDDLKELSWEGSSLEDLMEFPPGARRAMGFQLHLVQSGEMPDDWMTLNKLGKGERGFTKFDFPSTTIYTAPRTWLSLQMSSPFYIAGKRKHKRHRIVTRL